MKIFIAFQLLIIAAAAAAGFVISSSVDDGGIGGVSRFEDVRGLDFDVITTVDAAGTGSLSAFEGSGWYYDDSFTTAVFVCRAEDSLTCVSGTLRQSVTVEKHISGYCPKAGETVELTVHGGVCRYPKQMYFYNESLPEDVPSGKLLTVLNLQGLNLMKPGHSYLVACQTVRIGGVRYYGMPYGAVCWLDLADSENRLLPGIFREAAYADYAGNEFFCTSESALRSVLSQKHSILKRYGL